MRARARVHYATSPQAAVKQFEKEVRDDPENLAVRYGLAVALSADEQHDEAIALNDQLHSSNPHNILYAASYAEVLTRAGKVDQALALLVRELALNPDNPPLSMLYADALVADEQFEAAEAVLQRQSFVNKRDVDVWYDLAEVSGLAGNIVGVHLARAEFFTLHGAYQRAIQHLEDARRLTSRKNEQLHARLDQRITDLRDKLREARS